MSDLQITSSLVGRAGELETLYSLLSEKKRLITIVGPAGIGKTSLVMETYRQAQLSTSRWKSSGFLVECVSCQSSLDLVQALCSKLNTTTDRLNHVLGAISPAILLLDNFEHLVSQATETIAQWLALSESLHIVLTSRIRTALKQEHVIELAPLAIESLNSAAVELFIQRAKACRGTWVPSQQDRELVWSIVKRLEGNPLSIELAASRTHTLSLSQLNDRLMQSFQSLNSTVKSAITQHGPTNRHATLDAAIDWSWKLLSPDDQHALIVLSIFRGGFDIISAEGTLRTALPHCDPLALLQSLRNCSMIQFTEIKSHSLVETELIPRFSLYESVIEFVTQHHSTDPRYQMAMHIHTQHVIERASEQHRVYDRKYQSLVDWLVIESPNILSAIDHTTDPKLALRGLIALIPLVMFRRGISGYEQRIERAFDVYESQWKLPLKFPPESERLAWAEQVYLHAGEDLSLLIARVIGVLGSCVRFRGKPLGITLAEASVALGFLCKNRIEWVRSLGTLAAFLFEAGQPWRATYLFYRAQHELRTMNNPHLEGTIGANFGAILYFRGADRTGTMLSNAIAKLHSTGNLRAETVALNNFVLCQINEGLYDSAQKSAQEAIERAQQLGDPRTIGLANVNLGSIAFEKGHLQQAQEYFANAAASLHVSGSILDTSRTYGRWGLLYLSTRDYHTAQQHFHRAEQLALQMQHLVDATELQLCSAVTWAFLGQTDAAQDIVTTTQKKLAEHQHREALVLGPISLTYAVMAKHHAVRGEIDLAREFIKRARDGCALLSQTHDPKGYESRTMRRLINRELNALCPEESMLKIASDGSWFHLPGGSRVEVKTLGPQRILQCLARFADQGNRDSLFVNELATLVWENEKMIESAAYNRISVAISALRSQGLRTWINHKDNRWSLGNIDQIAVCDPEIVL